MITLDSIHAFCTLIESGNFRSAAARLNCTQPAVTQKIKRLELELGQPLLDAFRRTPTPQGRLFYDRGRELLMRARNIVDEVQDIGGLPERELRVGTSDTNALYFLPPYVQKFSKAWPDIKLEIYSRSTDEIATEVVRGNLDLGIITLPLDHKGLETKTLFEQRVVLVVPQSHTLSSRTRVSLASLRDEAFVLLEASTRTGSLLQNFFAQENFAPGVVMYSGSFEVIKRYVAEGLGIAFLPEMVLTDTDRPALSTVRVANVPQVSIGVIWQKERYQSNAASAFVKLLTP